jgi:hypothetical protein
MEKLLILGGAELFALYSEKMSATADRLAA